MLLEVIVKMSYEMSSDVGSDSYFSRMENLDSGLPVKSGYRSSMGLESTSLGYSDSGKSQLYGVNVEGAIH